MSLSKFKIIFLLVFFAGVFILPKISWAATINADSCSQTDVQNAINSAQDGDTVLVPAGNCIWTTRAGNGRTGKAPIFINNKNITLRGAGINETNITVNLTLTGYDNNAIVIYDDTKPFRVTGFTFISDGTVRDGLFYIQKNNSKSTVTSGWRIDHVRFVFSASGGGTNMNAAGYIYGYQEGLIDNTVMTVTNAIGSVFFVFVGSEDETGIPPNYQGKNSWNRILTLGTSHAVYLEDNVLDASAIDYPGNVVDAAAGGRYVFRYNTVYHSVAESHGACTAGTRGTFSWEVYENDFYGGDLALQFAIKERGGTGVIFNNRLYGTITYPIIVDSQRSDPAEYPYCHNGLNVRCDGNSSLDENTVPAETYKGWPCLDQIGATTGDIQSQTTAPVYIWGNTRQPSGISANNVSLNPALVGTNPAQSDHLKINRDWYEGIVKPGYSAYTYPHPLRTTGSFADGDTTPPLAPSGVAVQ